MLNVLGFIARSGVNGPGQRAVVWVQGCPLRCPGCGNLDSHAAVPRRLLSTSDLSEMIVVVEGIEGVTFSGGEPFEQAAGLAEVAEECHRAGLSIMFESRRLKPPPTSYGAQASDPRSTLPDRIHGGTTPIVWLAGASKSDHME